MARQKTNLHKLFADQIANIMMMIKFIYFLNIGLLTKRKEFSCGWIPFCLIEVHTQFSLSSKSIASSLTSVDPK